MFRCNYLFNAVRLFMLVYSMRTYNVLNLDGNPILSLHHCFSLATVFYIILKASPPAKAHMQNAAVIVMHVIASRARISV